MTPAKKKPTTDKALVCAKCSSTTFTSSGAQQFRGALAKPDGTKTPKYQVAHIRCTSCGAEQWSRLPVARKLARDADKAAKQHEPAAPQPSTALPTDSEILIPATEEPY